MARKRRVNPNTPGRHAIDWLKAKYQEGREFPDGHAIRDALIAIQPARFKSCTLGAVSNWDRQARYELADDKIFVTQPVRIQRYARNPNASPMLRQDTQTVKLRETAKRVENQYRIADAAAAQIDATRAEIRQAAELGVALRILKDIVT